MLFNLLATTYFYLKSFFVPACKTCKEVNCKCLETIVEITFYDDDEKFSGRCL